MASPSTVTWLGLGLVAANFIWGNLGAQLKSTVTNQSPSASAVPTPAATATVIPAPLTNGAGTTAATAAGVAAGGTHG